MSKAFDLETKKKSCDKISEDVKVETQENLNTSTTHRAANKPLPPIPTQAIKDEKKDTVKDSTQPTL